MRLLVVAAIALVLSGCAALEFMGEMGKCYAGAECFDGQRVDPAEAAAYQESILGTNDFYSGSSSYGNDSTMYSSGASGSCRSTSTRCCTRYGDGSCRCYSKRPEASCGSR